MSCAEIRTKLGTVTTTWRGQHDPSLRYYLLNTVQDTVGVTYLCILETIEGTSLTDSNHWIIIGRPGQSPTLTAGSAITLPYGSQPLIDIQFTGLSSEGIPNYEVVFSIPKAKEAIHIGPNPPISGEYTVWINPEALVEGQLPIFKIKINDLWVDAFDENQRILNEQGRQQNEATRSDAETQRIISEQTRSQQEQGRVDAELIRVNSENQRISNEQARETVKQEMITATNTANSAAGYAEEQGDLANNKANLANTKATLAQEAADLANEAAITANNAADALLSNVISLEIRDDMHLYMTTPDVYSGFMFKIENGSLIAII